MRTQTYKKFTEADVEAIGGLSPDDRGIPALPEVMDLAIPAVAKFKESVQGGRGIRNWWDAAKNGCRNLREANSETALGFLLRKGVQTVANDWYQTTPTAWRDYAEVAGSDTLAEWYAPLYGSVIADQVQRGQQFPEGRIIGEDSNVVNRKFGLIESVERELFDDDQTGQIKQRAQRLGQSMGVTESVWASSRFVGTARTYANVTVPASDYSTTDINGAAVTTPFSASLYGSTGNRPSSYGTLNIGNLKAAYQQLMNALDPLQNKIVTNPNCLLVSTQDAMNAQILLAPGLYPGVTGQSGGSGDAGAPPAAIGGTSVNTAASQGALTGFPGGVMSPNPFAGMGWNLVIERYLADWVWALGEKGKGFIFQERDPMEIVQETPNSGSYFTFDTIRWRSRRRFECEWIGGGSRFWYLGNDGSVTGNL